MVDAAPCGCAGFGRIAFEFRTSRRQKVRSVIGAADRTFFARASAVGRSLRRSYPVLRAAMRCGGARRSRLGLVARRPTPRNHPAIGAADRTLAGAATVGRGLRRSCQGGWPRRARSARQIQSVRWVVGTKRPRGRPVPPRLESRRIAAIRAGRVRRNDAACVPGCGSSAGRKADKEKAGDLAIAGFLIMARPEGFEPPTPKFVAWCSIQLSYGRLVEKL